MRDRKKNYRRRLMPVAAGCGEKPKPSVWKFGRWSITRDRPQRRHKWEHMSWNGNDGTVPWLKGSGGLSRTGWRCFHCGAMRWDDSDIEFAASIAKSWYGIDAMKLIEDAVSEKREAMAEQE